MLHYFTIAILAGACIVASVLFLLVNVPKWQAKRELSRYWNGEKEHLVYHGGLVFESLFKGTEHKIYVRPNRRAAPFTEPDEGSVMIKRYDGKTFFLEYLEVPVEIREYWENLVN